MPSCDVIVIGAGTNGLAAATHLASKGRRVLLLDSADSPGGAALGLAHSTRGLDPRVMAAMDLERHGLSFHPALPTTILGPAPLTVKRAATSGPDKAAYAALHAKLSAFARVLAPFRALTPPRLTPPRLTTTGNDWFRLARLGLGIRALGKSDFREFLRMILINVADVAEDELSDDRLRGLLSFDATLGAWAGPRSPNTLILLLNQLAIGPDILLPKGGMGQLAAAMTKAARTAGVDIRTGTQVARILTDADRAAGVATTDGQTFTAPIVISAISPRTTFQNLVGPRALDAGFYNRTQFIRSRGGAAKLHLTLKSAPAFAAPLTHRLVISPSVNAVENAFNPVKYGEMPRNPVMEILLPSAHDPSDLHTLSAIVQFAPHTPKAGLQAARAEMLENTLATLETHAPGLRALITHAELLMPQDIEARFGMVGGNWHHGELAVEQMLFLRPLREAAQYATPLPGLYLASAGCHPGGGITGAAGWNAAERILGQK